MIFVFSFVFLFLSHPPKGSPPDLWGKYKSSIDLTSQTFKCFDGSKTIPLSQFNDNTIDCHDGSDEPGTSAQTSLKFYCTNHVSGSPTFVDKWKVDDGVCDCCDCSDESSSEVISQNKHSCSQLEARRQKLINFFSQIYSEGFEMYKNYSVEGEKRYKHEKYERARLEHKISILEQMRQKVIDKMSYSDLEDPDHFVSEKDYVIPAETLEDDESFHDDVDFNDNNNIGDDEDDYYHYDRYDRYNDYRYHNYPYDSDHDQDYRSDYTHDYIPPPSDDNYNSNDNENINNNNNYDYNSNNYDYNNENNENNNYNQENDQISSEASELPKWKRIISKIWEYTFLFPDVDDIFEKNTDSNYYQNDMNSHQTDYDYGYHPYDKETTEKVEAIDKLLSPARVDLYNYDRIKDISSKTDMAFVYLLGKEFTSDQYNFGFMADFKKDYDWIGSYRSVDENNVMKYRDGSYCREKERKARSKSANVTLQCWNEDRLVRIIDISLCQTSAVFATPAACGNGVLQKLQNMTLEELENLNAMMKTNI